MKIDLELLSTLDLFKGIETKELTPLLKCFGYSIDHYKKNDVIFSLGDMISSCKVILSGVVQLSQTDIMGNRNIMFKVGKGKLFGEMGACMDQPSVLYAVAETDCTILSLDMGKILSSCSPNCNHHFQLMVNLIHALAEKGELFYLKAHTLAQKAARQRIMDFLNNQSRKTNQRQFEIVFSREELADYLCLNRSSLSRELCRMQDEGLIRFKRNFFELLYELPAEAH